MVSTTSPGPWNPPGEEPNTGTEQFEKYHWVDRETDPEKPSKRWSLPHLTLMHPRIGEWDTVEEGTESLGVLESICRDQKKGDENVRHTGLVAREI